MEVIERVSFEDAEKRYGLSRAGLKLRLKAVREALGLEPEREGTRAYLSGELLQAMDGLQEFKQAGGTEKAYLAGRLAEQGGERTSVLPQKGHGEAPLALKKGAVEELAGMSEGTAAVVLLVAQAVAEQVTARARLENPLAGLEALERAADRGWELSTAQVASLLGVSSTSIRGSEFDRHGFHFERVGKIGNQGAWSVSRPKKKK